MSHSARELALEERGKLPTRLELPAVDASEREALEALVGRLIGNYVVECLLGRGGMAVVYVARHPALGREVAVKLLSPEYQSEADLNRRFLQEARVTAGLHHPNIVEIYDLGEIDGRAYYTMERLTGKDLAAMLVARGPLAAEEAVTYLSQIATALDVAHQVGIVHRDLKPANIFVVEERPLLLKLMDFGIAKVSDARRGTATRRGEVLGTPAYMAPEQALGNIDAITARTDIYALGVIAYEMVTGRLPFVAESDLLLLTMHIRDTPQPILELAPQTPPELAELFERCLAKDPEDRPRSAAELRARLEKFRLEAPAPASAPARAEPLPPALLLSEVTDDPPTPHGQPVTLSSQEGKVLDSLLRRMQRRADFPSFLNNVTEISRKADADADYSAFQLGEAILEDYSLTAKLLRMVNSLYANRFGGKVFSVNQADLCHVIASSERKDYKPTLVRLLGMHKGLLSFDEKDVGALLGTVCKSFEARYSSLYGPYHRKCRFLFNARGITGEPMPKEPPLAGPPSEDEVARLGSARRLTPSRRSWRTGTRRMRC